MWSAPGGWDALSSTDSSNELTSQIIAQYNNIVQEKEEEEESSNKVTRISVFKAITALNTLKLYKE
jgi:hypothetical protein